MKLIFIDRQTEEQIVIVTGENLPVPERDTRVILKEKVCYVHGTPDWKIDGNDIAVRIIVEDYS